MPVYHLEDWNNLWLNMDGMATVQYHHNHIHNDTRENEEILKGDIGLVADKHRDRR
jgi:hypothetical protein